MEDKYPVIKHVKSILSELGPDENIKRFYELDPSIRTEFNNVVRELLNASADNYFNRLSKRAYKVRNKFPQLPLSVYGVDPVGDYTEAIKLLRNG